MVDTKAKYLFLEIRTLDVDCGVGVAEAWRRSVRHRDDFNCLGVLIGHSTNQGALDQFAGLMVALQPLPMGEAPPQLRICMEPYSGVNKGGYWGYLHPP